MTYNGNTICNYIKVIEAPSVTIWLPYNDIQLYSEYNDIQ